MLDALVNLAGDEDFAQELPPTGFYNYSQPIRWTVQISEDSARLEESNLEGIHWARPYTGRTSGIDPHPLADEASYALGKDTDDKGKKDDRASDKHASFVALLEKIQATESVGENLREATGQILKAIRQGWLEKDARYNDINSKDWVAFELSYGPLAGKRLFTLPEARAFWVAEAQERIAVRDSANNIVMGECAVCGQNKPLIGRIPVGVKLISKPGPLHSLNASAFVSGRTDTKGHNNLCYECGDTASRAFNALASDKEHRRIIVMDKSVGGKVKLDSLRNQVALFWIEKGSQPLPQTDFDFFSVMGDLMKPVSASNDDLEEDSEEKPKTKAKKGKQADVDVPRPQATLSQLSNFLNIRYQATNYMTNLDGAKFALAIFSPNVGRTALRQWLYKDLDKVIPNARLYLNATKINSSWGETGEPQSINALMEAIDSKNPNLTRDLISTAYEGTLPPQEMQAAAVRRFVTLMVKGQQDKQLAEWQRQRHLHSLAAALKLSLFYKAIRESEGGQTYMTGVEKLHNDAAYLCGRMLAILEEAQQVYTYRQYKKRLKTTGVQRSFGSASATPFVVLTNLLKLATKAHMPKAGKYLNTELEQLVAQITAQGGYPNSLDIAGQGRLGLGYWHQRGEIRAHWSPEEKKADEQAEQDDTEGGSL